MSTTSPGIPGSVFCLLFGVAGITGEPEGTAGPSQESALEEIVISAPVETLTQIRRALDEAEDRFYARWNALNDDDRYDIQCRIVAPTGSRLARRRCEIRLVEDAARQEATSMFFVVTGDNKLKATDDIRANATLELKRRTLPLLETDVELRQALLERTKLQQLYDSLRQQQTQGTQAPWE